MEVLRYQVDYDLNTDRGHSKELVTITRSSLYAYLYGQEHRYQEYHGVQSKETPQT
jgi:hypothetical protein